jgi:tetratricopeptide (TPR) repeat protein
MTMWDRTTTEPAKKKTVTPEVAVRYGDFRLGESMGAKYPPARRDQLQEDARDAYQQALALDTKCVPAHRGLANVYLLRGDYPRAIDQYQKVLSVVPNDASLWYDAGVCANYGQQWDRAITALKRAVELDGQSRQYANALGVVLARTGRLDESLQAFARVNSEAQAHYNLGCTLRRLGDENRGRQHLEIAVQKDPKLTSAQNLLAEMFRPQGAPATTIQQASHTEAVPTNGTMLIPAMGDTE